MSAAFQQTVYFSCLNLSWSTSEKRQSQGASLRQYFPAQKRVIQSRAYFLDAPPFSNAELIRQMDAIAVLKNLKSGSSIARKHIFKILNVVNCTKKVKVSNSCNICPYTLPPTTGTINLKILLKLPGIKFWKQQELILKYFALSKQPFTPCFNRMFDTSSYIVFRCTYCILDHDTCFKRCFGFWKRKCVA